MIIELSSQKERDLAFEHGIGVDCPLCGSSVIILKKVNLRKEYRSTDLATARFEWHCYWCEHDWATTAVVLANLFSPDPDIVPIISDGSTPNPFGTPMEDHYDTDPSV